MESPLCLFFLCKVVIYGIICEKDRTKCIKLTSKGGRIEWKLT